VALPPSLHSVDLTYHCPHCGHPLVMPGRWFKSAWRFKCKSCKSDVHLSYSNKIALFGRHRDPVQRATETGGAKTPRVK
jgi:transposase-like protein